jgi:hypothetical protein
VNVADEAGDGMVVAEDSDSLLSEEPALPASVLARLEVMSTTLAGVATRLRQVAASNSKTRRLAVGLVVSVGLDVALTIVVTLLTLTSLHQNTELHSSQLSACAIGNATRANERELWAHLIAIDPRHIATLDQSFQAYVDKTFANVNCAQVYK